MEILSDRLDFALSNSETDFEWKTDSVASMPPNQPERVEKLLQKAVCNGLILCLAKV